VRANLSREDGKAATEAEVYALLFESGFRRFGGQWVGPEEALSVLRPEEVTALEEAPGDNAPLLLSREYEDYLDWLENRRRSRTRSRRRSLVERLSDALAALGRARSLLRRR
jgi:hypothetical protein